MSEIVGRIRSENIHPVDAAAEMLPNIEEALGITETDRSNIEAIVKDLWSSPSQVLKHLKENGKVVAFQITHDVYSEETALFPLYPIHLCLGDGFLFHGKERVLKDLYESRVKPPLEFPVEFVKEILTEFYNIPLLRIWRYQTDYEIMKKIEENPENFPLLNALISILKAIEDLINSNPIEQSKPSPEEATEEKTEKTEKKVEEEIEEAKEETEEKTSILEVIENLTNNHPIASKKQSKPSPEEGTQDPSNTPYLNRLFNEIAELATHPDTKPLIEKVLVEEDPQKVVLTNIEIYKGLINSVQTNT